MSCFFSHRNRLNQSKRNWLVLLLTVCMLLSMIGPLEMSATDSRAGNTDSPSLSEFLQPSGLAEVESGSEALFADEKLTVDNLPFALTLTEAAAEGFVSRVKSAEADLYSAVLKNNKGDLTLYYYDQPIKYIDEYGEIQDKSDQFYAYKDGSFGTLASDIQTDLPRQLKDGISLCKDNIRLNMSPVEEISATGVLSADEKTVTYTQDSATRYEYSLTAMGFKENIVVSEYTGQTEYSFVLKTNGLTPVKVGEAYDLIDSEGSVRASISEIIIFTADERNNTFGDLNISEIIPGEAYRLTISLDSRWLSDEKTAYPIIIDPSVTLTIVGNIEDVMVGSSSTHSGTSGSIYVGRNSFGLEAAGTHALSQSEH